ncbi:MAG: glucose-1-phosphate adenylyltransferase subunit GlgD [Defluviitaleaceae bacterium]|nr:glucose-1-phosphate adenylyltransferase subunit GlgD [Defluviitaleaceae bacterium]
MKALGIIFAGGQKDSLKELTQSRASSAMPVGSCYRAIDFSLSNMVNSGINKVAVMTQYNSRSLHDHLNSSKWWGFGTKHGGLFVLSPFLSKDNSSWFRGTADSIYQNMTYLRRSREEYVIITSGDGIYKMDYNRILDFHIEKNADITVACKEMYDMDVSNFGVVSLDEGGRLVEFEEKPLEPFSSVVSLGIYVMRRELLIELLEAIIPQGRHDFVRDIVIRYRKQKRVYGFMYEGYWAGINSIESYYNINMDFLRADIRNEMFNAEPFIKTKNKDEPPAKYNTKAEVRNALVGSGSIVDGSIENSVLFRNVHVKENAVVRNSIILEGSEIAEGCVIEHAIIDKLVKISPNQRVVGTAREPKIVRKNTTI